MWINFIWFIIKKTFATFMFNNIIILFLSVFHIVCICLMKSFKMIFINLNVLFEVNFFMISINFFFITIVKQFIDNKYVASKISLKPAENDAKKNSSIKNHVLFSKNVVNFLSTSFCVFLISVSIFNNSLKTWLLILIYLIKVKHYNFFYSRYSYQSFCEISRFLFCIWSFICNHSHENKSFNFFHFVNQWIFDAIFSFF